MKTQYFFVKRGLSSRTYRVLTTTMSLLEIDHGVLLRSYLVLFGASLRSNNISLNFQGTHNASTVLFKACALH